MKRFFKWTGMVAAVLIVVVLVVLAGIYLYTGSRMDATYDVEPAPVTVPTDSAAVERGRHVAVTRGCLDCHGEDGSGTVVIDEPPVARLTAPNLTPEGAVGTYTNTDWVRAIRHGIDPSGKPLLFMPSHEFYHLSDEDLGALIAFLNQVAAAESDLPETTIGPMARLLYTTGEMDLIPAELIPHDASRPEAPEPGPTAEYGAYLAVGCTSCHGEGLSGGKIPGGPPDWPLAANITPDVETGIGSWTEEDFFRALREGRLPDGSQMSDAMPWQMTRHMTDEEIRAIWRYLQSLPPRVEGNR